MRTFRIPAENPVIPDLRDQPEARRFRDFRNPKVFWHEPTGRWEMVVAGDFLQVYSSPDLRDWTLERLDTGINPECPDLFALPVDGNDDDVR